MASIDLPPAKYPLFDALGDEFVENGKLSQLQLEGILYACQKHCDPLPDGKRSGFMIGDGAGVGKGRQISGIIIDNYVRGRRRAVWISSSGDLHRDAERDLGDPRARDEGDQLVKNSIAKRARSGCRKITKRACSLPHIALW